MVGMERLEKVCQAMAEPAFYPHSVSRLERIDTHISVVFLTGEWVYKLKKPVDFGFLDFTALDARRHFCEQEVRLNQRLSKSIYEGVVEIRKSSTGRFSLAGEGEVEDYAVKMRQLPEESNLKVLCERQLIERQFTERQITERQFLEQQLLGQQLLERQLLERQPYDGGQCPSLTQAPTGIEELDLTDLGKEISRAHMEALGRCLADFYARSERSPEIDRFGDPEVIGFNMEENFRQMEPFVGDLVPRERWEFTRQVSRAFFKYWHDLFERRVPAGRIRDGHGDLRAEHIYFYEGIQIIDCIEFNERFRYGDVVADLAFLHMDLEHLGYPDLSQAFLASYVRRAADPQLYTLLDFYAAYRAVVKLKVNCLRLTEVEDPVERHEIRARALGYLQQAYRYALQFSRPTLWIFCGLPATGKSTLASKLADALSLSLFQSDRVRKESEGIPLSKEMVVAYDEGIYRREMRNRVYARMLALAQEQLKGGRSVILDASFSKRKWREEARQLASDLDTNFIAVECTGSEEAIRARLLEREHVSGVSDARLQHLSAMIRDFEPLTETFPETHLALSTDRPLEEAFLQLLSASYARRCIQVRRVSQ